MSEALGPLLHKVCKGSEGVKLKAVVKTDGFNGLRVLAFWFEARFTNDSMSLLTMIMNPDRAKDLSDMTNKLDHWDALIRDHEMKFEKDDIFDKNAPCSIVRGGSRCRGREQVGWEKRPRQLPESPLHDRWHDQGQERSEGSHQIEWRRQSTADGRRPTEAQRDDVGLRGRSERRRE